MIDFKVQFMIDYNIHDKAFKIQLYFDFYKSCTVEDL